MNDDDIDKALYEGDICSILDWVNGVKGENMEEEVTIYDRKMVYHEKEKGLGGRPGTVCVLWDGDSRYVGWSRCHSMDQFNRKLGHKIAYGRALQALKEHSGLSVVRMESKGYGALNVADPVIEVSSGREAESRYTVPSFLYREDPKEVNYN